ncbi:MAG: hypothetical protein H7281_16420, partial [Bacteriovorax sp.]|nr:hypothetical protein [Bacteriovorax sp.]
MKKLLVLGVLVTMNVFSAERVLVNDNKKMDAELNSTTVRCSMIGYGSSELKITLKGLDGWTLFDHSNFRAGDSVDSPCMTAGQCKRFPKSSGFSIDDILANGDKTETVVVNRQIIEVKEVSKDESGADVCSRHIEERLATTVTRADSNGKIKFSHLRFGLAETFPLSV